MSGARVVDRRTGNVLEGTVDLGPTLDRIKSGGSFPLRNDGSVFRNAEGLLPSKPAGYYRELVHPTPGVSGPGPQRVIQGRGGELYYTPEHYGSFVPLNPGGSGMSDLTPFRFVTDSGEPSTAGRLVVQLPSGLGSKQELLETLYALLNLPGYFGNNWDALSDCLRDFHWVSQREVVIVHQDLPALGANDLRSYLRVLADAALDWKPDEYHVLYVHFPASLQRRVEASVA